jgi:membrane-bound lytic murein transglycosylase D
MFSWTYIRNLPGSLLLMGSVALPLSAAFPLVAHAAYDNAVTWADMSSLDLRPVFRSQYASDSNLFDPLIPTSGLDTALRDADSRISQEFRIPPGMRESVAFWMRIYTEYTTQHIVLFDTKHLDIVYEVLDFRELGRTARNRVVYEILMRKKVRDTIAGYRAAFARLIKDPRPKNPSLYERKVLAAIKKSSHNHPIRELARGLRTQTGQRDNIIKGLLAAEVYLPKMEQIFLQYGVPPEITRLSLVESSFDFRAVSRVGATGVWQFMFKSGKEFMHVNPQGGIDERLSPLKSTVAAAKLLRRNRKILGNWAFSIISYNHGLRTLLKLPKEKRERGNFGYVLTSCDPHSKLGWASRNYYSEFLAVLYAEAYRHLFYGTAPVPASRTIRLQAIKSPKTAMELAIEHGLSPQEFHTYNPDIKNIRMKLPKGFQIAVPGESDDVATLGTGKAKSGV